MDAATGIITTVAGNGTLGFSGDGGPAASAALASPWGLAVDASGNIFVADRGNSVIRRVDSASGTIATIAGIPDAFGFSGDSGPAIAAKLNGPFNLAIDSSNNLVIGDSFNGRIRKIHLTPAAVFTGSPSDFGPYGVGITSAAQTISLSNTGAASLLIQSIVATGAFAATGDCVGQDGGQVAPMLSCTISVTFTPTGVGVTTGTLTITSNDPNIPVQTFNLSGTGVLGGAANLSAMNLTFAPQLIGSTSEPQTVVVTNTGTTPLTIASIAVTGADSNEFGETNNCPIAPATLPATQGVCTISVTFAPLAVGSRTATVTITDNQGGVPGSQQTVTLTGIGVPQPPTTTTQSLTFTPGTNVFQTATFNCPSGTVPCTDPNAHSLKLTVTQVLTPFTLTVTAFEVPLSQANGDCASGQTETTDFDCRFKDNFTIQTLPDGDTIVPQCNAYSNGNCVFYRVGNTPPTSAYQGPVLKYVAWNNTAFIPPPIYAANNPRLYDNPDSPPYHTNHQFVFDITDYFNSGAGQVGLDPGIAGHTKQFNDFVVASLRRCQSGLHIYLAAASSVPEGCRSGFRR